MKEFDDDPVPEGATREISGLIHDEKGVAIPGSSLLTVHLKLYDQRSGQLIADRSIKNAGGGTVLDTVDAAGKNFYLVLSPADMVIVNAERALEKHVAHVKWTYTNLIGPQGGHEEFLFTVRNLKYVP